MTNSIVSDVTNRFADFCIALRYEDLQPEVIAEAKNAILDWLGVALVGSTQESTRLMLKIAGVGGKGKVTLLGMGRKTSAGVATLVNGFAGHALDYDDAQHRCATHISSPVLPAVLALAETHHHSGKDLLVAYLTGFEVGCRLGRAARFGNHLRMHGIHPTGFLGHFGAAAAAGKLLKLDALQTNSNLGIVAGRAAGLIRSLGTMCKPVNAGSAAQDGLLAAALAKRGFTGPEDIFDGEHNIFSITGGETDTRELVQDLGRQFEITHNTYKAFPCTGWRNSIAEASMVLSATHGLQSRDVKKIHMQLHPEMTRLPDKPQPKTGLEGKFSVAHVAAVALVDRAAGISQFTDERVADPELAELRNKVTFEADAGLNQYQVRMSIHSMDGRELTHFIPFPKGDHLRPMSQDEFVAKFRANALTVLPERQVEKLSAMVWNLEAVDDIAELTHLCRTGDG